MVDGIGDFFVCFFLFFSFEGFDVGLWVSRFAGLGRFAI